MKIVLPTDTAHTLVLIPRFYVIDSIIFELTNEANNEKEIITHTYNIVDGVMSLYFDYTFTEKQRFAFKLSNEDGVIFRGKILCTSQETQDYKQTFELYEY